MNPRHPGWDGPFGGRGMRGGGPAWRLREALGDVAEAAQDAGEQMDDGPDDRRRGGPRGRGGPHGRGGGPHGRGRRPGPRGGFGPGGFGPGGFGPGGFGPGGFGPGGVGRRGGRRTNRGDVRTAVLAVVAEQPRHGYEIIQEITERTDGQWKPSPGSVYPTLSQLEDEGLVRVEQTEGRRVVHLTEEGTRYVEEHRSEIDAVWSAFEQSDAENDPAMTLWQELGQLHGAAQQIMSAGTPEQIASATESLAEARKAIYRLLAE